MAYIFILDDLLDAVDISITGWHAADVRVIFYDCCVAATADVPDFDLNLCGTCCSDINGIVSRGCAAIVDKHAFANFIVAIVSMR